MAANPAVPDRDHLHWLVNLLPVKEISAAGEYLRERALAGDPLLLALADAPEDDEPLTPEDEAALEEGLAALRRGEVVPADEVWRRLGHAP